MSSAVELQSVGPLTLDEDLGWYYSAPVRAGSLRGSVGRIVVPEDLIEDGATAVDDAAAEFLTADDEGLRAAGVHAFDYYLDTVRLFREQGWNLEMPRIAGPESVWEFVSFGAEFHVERDVDGQVYISVECECAWEPEHGLQLVFRGGRTVSKVGPYDGHLTNAAAFAREDLRGLVYISPFST